VSDLNRLLVVKPSHGTALVLKVHCLIAEGNYQQTLEIIKLGKAMLAEVDQLQQLAVAEASVHAKQSHYDQALNILSQI
jgi:uncharacterized protein HemY